MPKDKIGFDIGGLSLFGAESEKDVSFGLRISRNRESNFDIESGRFHDPDTGMFEPGSPPPDLDTSVDRYRANDGKFKGRSADLYDENDEVIFDSLIPED